MINGNGNVSTVDGATSGATISVVTGADGKAACIWRTDFVTARQSVTARLADVESKDFVAELPQHLRQRAADVAEAAGLGDGGHFGGGE